MATPFRLKRSAVANKRPGLTDLQLGELALNTYDGRLFAERDTGGVGIGTTIALLTPFTENYGGGSIYYNDGSVGIGTTNPIGKFEVFGGRIVGAATSNVIPFLYSDYSDLPSASSYHGAFAHVHSAGKGFFAHAGNWIEIVSKETNGTVGSGTERYNVGPTDLTTLNVSGISTLTGDVSFGSTATFGDDDKLKFGDGEDLQIYHSGSASYIRDQGTGPLVINSDNLRIKNVADTENVAWFKENGSVDLYYDNSKKFETTSTGVAVSGVASATSYVGDGATLSGIVTSLVAGSNITLSGSSGQVTISSSGGGGGTGGKFVSNNTGIHTLSNVGIGTTNASDDLTVRGDIAFTGRLKVTDLGLAGSNGQYLKSVGSGVTWASFPDARTSQTFTAADGQTTFTFTYNVNFIDVYVNGVKLATSEFTATNGTSIVLDEACFSGDIVEVISFNTTATGGGGSGGITDVVQDATPQLGGNLDLNSKSITGTGNVSISGIVTATSFVGGLTGNSSSATQLQTSRNIGGVAFNGTSNINLPGVNQTGTQSINTTGIVTASSLVGTGVSVVGVVTATSFVGSGANLTGVLTPTGNGIGLSGIVTSIIAGTNVTISGATGAVTINASGGGGGGSIAGISTTGTSHFANLQLTGITTGLNVSGVSTFAGNVSFGSSALFGDDDKILLGTGSDLEIYHDGTTGNIHNDTGTLILQSSNVRIQDAGSSQTAFSAADGVAKLYFENSEKLETTNTGAVVTGILTATSFSGDGSALTGIAVTASSNFQVTWDVTANGSSAYRFAGPGNDASDDNPDLYLVRGQRYRFTNNSGGSHPFQIRSSAGGSAYSTGVTNNGASSGNIDFNVQHDAPARLYYQCTSHSGMVGNIYITGGANWQTTDVNTSTAEEIFTLNNVGIGTDNPTNLLHVDGGTDQLKLSDGSGSFEFRAGNVLMIKDNGTERLRILSDGKVAIGGVTANSQLDVHGGDGISITHSGDTFLQSRTTGTTGTNYLEFKDSGGGSGAISYHHNGNSLRFKVNGSERLRITSDGNVNIGGEYSQTDSQVTIVDVSRPIAEATLNLQSSTTSGAADTGSVLRFYGHSGSEGRYHASIKGAKENGTSGNTAGYLAFNTRPAGGAMAEAARFNSSGNLVFPSGQGIDFSATSDGSGTVCL